MTRSGHHSPVSKSPIHRQGLFLFGACNPYRACARDYVATCQMSLKLLELVKQVSRTYLYKWVSKDQVTKCFVLIVRSDLK